MTDQEAINLVNETCSDSFGRIYDNRIKQNQELFKYLSNRYTDSESFKETLFRMKNNIEVRPVCVLCGGKVKFDHRESHHHLRNNGYYWHCSTKCSENDKEVRDKIKNTCLERYGDEHNWGINSNVRYKCGETFHKNYDTQEKLNELLNKRGKTKLERYGDENYNNRQKFKQTNLERYGTEYYFNQEKAKQTKIERYGDSKYNNSEKMLETKYERYGNGNPGFEKARKTMLERYGVEYYFQSPECIAKSHTLDVQLKANQTRCKNGTNRKSHLETTLKNFVENIHPNLIIEENKRKYLDGLEIDIYLPELKFGIEVQGDYFHANPLFYKKGDLISGLRVEDIWKKDEHKLDVAKQKGIVLLQIWEHEIKTDIESVYTKISEQINARL